MVTFPTRKNSQNNRVEPQLPQPIDMKELQRRIEEGGDYAPGQVVPVKGDPRDYAPPSIREVRQPEPESTQDLLEKVRALSIKAVNTYGDRVIDEVTKILREHLEIVLKIADRAKQIEDHYRSEMEAVQRETNVFTNNAKNDLERLAGLAPIDPSAKKLPKDVEPKRVTD